MNEALPDYFLADLPRDAVLTPDMVAEACRNLKSNRARFLADRTTASVIQLLSGLGEDWLVGDFPFRKQAIEQSVSLTGFPPATLTRGLDAFFSQVTPDNLETLLDQELDHPLRLDQMIGSNTRAIARGPELLVHITAGNVPAPALMSILLGLLVRSAQFIKCATGTSGLVRLFAHSIYQRDPKLGACLEVAEWPGGRVDLEQPLFEAAECVTATGADETLAAIRNRLPPHVRFLGYGHRVSFAYIAHEMLTGRGARELAIKAAMDVTAWNQFGCLSPHVIYLEMGGSVTPEQFAAFISEELQKAETTEPRGAISVEESAQITATRGFYRVRAAASAETQLWQSADSTAWTVVYEQDQQFQLSCLNRFVFVKPVRDLGEALHNAAIVKGKVSTVALAAPRQRAEELAVQLARWGATRICPVGHMQSPPLTWRHDGRPGLGDLITWTDWES
ncbi:MAG TPA: acyl-CoA reductase [Verrucomicrobiae bacterium]|nr:acyl-CoA reductase [Verrucomicrobiae bacterium]